MGGRVVRPSASGRRGGLVRGEGVGTLGVEGDVAKVDILGGALLDAVGARRGQGAVSDLDLAGGDGSLGVRIWREAEAEGLGGVVSGDCLDHLESSVTGEGHGVEGVGVADRVRRVTLFDRASGGRNSRGSAIAVGDGGVDVAVGRRLLGDGVRGPRSQVGEGDLLASLDLNGQCRGTCCRVDSIGGGCAGDATILGNNVAVRVENGERNLAVSRLAVSDGHVVGEELVGISDLVVAVVDDGLGDVELALVRVGTREDAVGPNVCQRTVVEHRVLGLGGVLVMRVGCRLDQLVVVTGFQNCAAGLETRGDEDR